MVQLLKKVLDSNPSDAPDIKKIIIQGMFVLIVMLGSFMVWALFARIDAAAIAPGKITVESNRKTIQHLEGGIIKKIHIKDGTVVNAGDVLIELEDTQAHASLALIQGQLWEFMAQEARLLAERDDAKTISYPPALMAIANNPKVKKIIRGQQGLFIANRNTLDGQYKILGQRISQLHKEIDSLNAQVTSQTKQLKLINEEVKAVAYLEKKRLIERPRLLALQREAARLVGNRGEHLALIARAEQRIGESKQRIISIKADNLRETLTQLGEAQKRIAELSEREKAAKDILIRTKIIAPKSGTIVNLQKHTIAGVVTPGQEVLGIVPNKDELIIEARVNPLDIDVVHPGLRAKIQLTALKSRSTPTLEGTVQHVSADSIHDERTNETYYTAKILISKSEIKKLRQFKLYPGMPVNVMIITDNRTPMAYFLAPLKESMNKAFKEQ